MLIETGMIQIEEFKLQYTIEGQGKPALVIGSAIYYPRTFSQNLKNHLKLISVDHRGFSTVNTITDTKKFELDILLNDIDQVRKKLNLENFIIIGHSGHTYLALEYAKKYPEHISHVVLIGAGPDQSATSNKEAETYFNETVDPDRKAYLEENLKKLESDFKNEPGKRLIHLLIRLGAKSWYDYKFDSTKLWEGVKVNDAMFDYVWGKLFANIDITKGLESFNKPVFLGLGHFDFIVAPFYSWNKIRSKFNNLTVKLFKKSGHTPQLEEPENFDRELLDWLSKK